VYTYIVFINCEINYFMKRVVKNIGQGFTGAAAIVTLWAGRVMAEGNPAQEGAEAGRGDGMPADLVGANGVFTQITNTILYAVGIISVIMLIWGGLRYVISGGDSKKVTDAKNTIMYAIIGLIIAILAFAIVNFVINAISGAPTES
jgi:hypothetical protein